MNTTKAQDTSQGPFIHYVLFWLKEPSNEAVRARFSKSLTDFVYNCKHVRSVHVGTPASTSRPVIDSSYTYNLVVSFDNKEGHDLYQADPLHKKFIEESSELWERVLVYDSELIG